MPGPDIDDTLKATGGKRLAIVVGAGGANYGFCAELLRDVQPVLPDLPESERKRRARALVEGRDIRTLREPVTPAHDGRHDRNPNMLRVADPRDRIAAPRTRR